MVHCCPESVLLCLSEKTTVGVVCLHVHLSTTVAILPHRAYSTPHNTGLSNG
jgi:hypothetical protein